MKGLTRIKKIVILKLRNISRRQQFFDLRPSQVTKKYLVLINYRDLESIQLFQQLFHLVYRLTISGVANRLSKTHVVENNWS